MKPPTRRPTVIGMAKRKVGSLRLPRQTSTAQSMATPPASPSISE